MREGKKGMGVHVLLNLYGCSQNISYIKDIKNVVDRVINKSSLSFLSEKYHQFDPEGVTGIVLLAESHLSIHSWPEHGSVAIDIFCCFLNEEGEKKAIEKANTAAENLIELFNPEEYKKKEVIR